MSEKSRIFVGLSALVTLTLAPVPATLHGTEEESRLRWHTYAGSSIDDTAKGIAVDPGGNVYLTGWSDATWGSPILPHSGGRDNFVAKLKSTGELEWNTFLGPLNAVGPSDHAIAVDGSGNVFVVGTIPGEAPFFFGQGWGHFVAKLNSNGELQWRNLGAETYWGVPTTVAVDTLGNIYVGGWGGCWSAPGAHVGDGSWVGKLDSSGAEVWRALVGCSFETGAAQAAALAVDASGNTHLTGRSSRSWGNPIDPYAGGQDAWVVKLNSNGFPQWNTFMGSPSSDSGGGIAVDRSGDVICVW